MQVARILIIDDDPLIATLVRDVLMLWREEDPYIYEIDSALNGAQGLERARGTEPDVILLDYHMPVMKGDEVLKALRSTGNMTPVIIMTGACLEDIASSFFMEGNAYLPKPFEPALLCQRVREQLCQKRAKVVV